MFLQDNLHVIPWNYHEILWQWKDYYHEITAHPNLLDTLNDTISIHTWEEWQELIGTHASSV